MQALPRFLGDLSCLAGDKGVFCKRFQVLGRFCPLSRPPAKVLPVLTPRTVRGEVRQAATGLHGGFL